MNRLRVSPHEIDGDILKPFLPAGHKIDQNRDKRLNPLREHLAEAYSVHSRRDPSDGGRSGLGFHGHLYCRAS
jgi:hypothetical protein